MGAWGKREKRGRLFLQGEGLVPKPLSCPCLPLSPNRSFSERMISLRSLYREKRHKCGKYLEVDIFPVFEYQHSRGKKRKPTSDVQKRLNQLNAEKKLIRLLNTNFTNRDIRFDLTYNADHLPESPEDAQREMQNFLRRVKRFRKRQGLPDLKYVAVTEVGKHTGRIHHHIIMSGGIDVSDLSALWGRGYTTVKPLMFDDTGIVGIAKYFVKEPILGKRWCASKNLDKPGESQRDGRIPKYEVKRMSDGGIDCREYLEKLYDGYALAECQPFYNDVNGGYYITIIMYQKTVKKRQTR